MLMFSQTQIVFGNEIAGSSEQIFRCLKAFLHPLQLAVQDEVQNKPGMSCGS